MSKSIYSDDYQHFLKVLKEVRKRAGLRQRHIAAALGTDQSVVSRVERGRRRLDVVELRRWLLAVNISVPEFYDALDSRLSRHSRLPAPGPIDSN